jgi:hypothetical protein
MKIYIHTFIYVKKCASFTVFATANDQGNSNTFQCVNDLHLTLLIAVSKYYVSPPAFCDEILKSL